MGSRLLLYVTALTITVVTRIDMGSAEDGFARNQDLFNPPLKTISERNVETVIRQRPILPTLTGQQRLHPDLSPRFAVDDYRPGAANNLLDISAPENSVQVHSEWSDWSECSRTCGTGVSSRTRQCKDGFSRQSVTMCDGPQTQHKLCASQACSEDAPGFREVQCSQQDDTALGTKKFGWVPYSGSEGGSCELLCMAEHFHFFRSFGQAKDGTNCGEEGKDKCISGECVKIGCDMVIGSNKAADACGVCGGNNGTCFHYENVFDRLDEDAAESSDYREVAVIPVGATHIQVKDYNKNYLTLKETDGTSERFIVNGNWVVSWPGKFKTAGSILTYTREEDKETFEIVGPITKTLHLMVLSLGDQPLIEYEYWIPNSLRPSDNTLGELRVHKTSIEIPEEDYLEQILAAGFDYDEVLPPTFPQTTKSTTTVATTTTTVATTTTTTPATTTERLDAHKDRVSLVSRPTSKAKSTYRSMNKKRRFCTSDFVIHAQIISKRRVQRGRYIRYDVELLTTYKTEFQLMRREYIWVPSVKGSKLRPFRHYLMMGRKVRVDVTDEGKTDDIDLSPIDGKRRYENRLIVDYTDYWYPWRKSYDVKMSRMANHINCRRYRYRPTVVRYRRRRTHT